MKNLPIKPSDILVPKNNFEKWSVIACDQFTSNREYWDDVKNTVGDYPSTYKITLPEIYLEDGKVEERIENINSEMKKYVESGVFEEYKNCFVYIERKQADGRIRQGLVVSLDLEDYDYNVGSKSLIRATEKTVLERIPPRVKIRKNAILETPHVMVLIDDKNKKAIEPLAQKKSEMKKIYDFELMKNGGHIAGYILPENEAGSVLDEIYALKSDEDHPLLFAVGDGNHSLATAKACYEAQKEQFGEKAKESPARYALVELVNIHSDAIDFEPIYRVLFNVNAENVISKAKEYFKTEKANSEFDYYYKGKSGKLPVFIPADKIETGVIQEFIDSYIKDYPETKVDYIHGISEVKELSEKENSVGFIFGGIGKDSLFADVQATGSLPKKTFSMGEGHDKRYYLECRKIK